MTESIRKEIILPHSQQHVWRALTDSSALAEWMYPNDCAPSVGHRFTFRVPPNPKSKFDGIVHCEVLTCVPPREFAYRWVAGGFDREINTCVSFRLEADGTGTRLILEHSGFEMEQALKGAEYGWNLMLGNLEKLLDAARAQR